ncbi:MAG: hypothetical protein V4501_08835 [Pseudomonadota bacterium]
MKFKTLAIMAAAALLTAPLAYAAPTTLAADDMGATSPSADMGNVGAPNSSEMSTTTGGPQASNDMMPGSPTVMGANQGSQTPTDSSNSNDDMSADTATGDDDY